MPERPVPHPKDSKVEVADSDTVRSLPKPRRKLKIGDILIFVVLAIVVIVLVTVLMKQLSLKHEVSSARGATNSFLADIRKQDATTAFKFGDSAFRAKYTEKELANLFTSLHTLIRPNPTIIKQTADNGTANQVVSIYYKFTDKPTYYFAVTVIRPNGTTKWQLLNFSGSPTQADLFKTQ